MKKIPTLLDLYEAIKPYTIYCDMDGVLCDFDQGYEKLTGESTDEANAKGKSYFWKLFRESVGKNEKDFWANLPWQPGGEELWNHIKPSSPNILSAPAVDFNLPQDQQLNPEFNQAIQGKKEWISKHLNGVNKEIFVPAPQKSTFATSKHILIDDMQKNIDAWKAAGGKAILHTSAPKTIEALKKYDL
jgi:beta-phosphoglucomutase-like phosphatase (HAD superfamily)